MAIQPAPTTDPTRRPPIFILVALAIVILAAGAAIASRSARSTIQEASPALVAEGQKIFRFDTFGNEAVWTDALHLNEVVEKNVDPTTALKVGLKVDADVLPPGILDKVDLKSPATTVALLKMNAVVGLQASVDANNHITRLGVTCALCHSTVDNSVMPGIRNASCSSNGLSTAPGRLDRSPHPTSSEERRDPDLSPLVSVRGDVIPGREHVPTILNGL